MKVSIIVPVYNVEKYIERCFNSISNQTYKNIECIFIDDCSPDNCNMVLRKLISGYKGEIKFKIIKHERNKGLSGARNTGTIYSKGEYIYYLDSDDELTPESIQSLVNLAEKYEGVDLVQGNTETIPNPAKEKDWRNISSKFPEFSNDKIWIKERFFRQPKIPVNAWNKLVKRDFLTDNNLYFREGIIHEDEHWMFYLAKKINSIAFCETICYKHYIVKGSIMQTNNNLKSIESMYQIIKEIAENVDEKNNVSQRRYIYLLILSCFKKIDILKKSIFYKKLKLILYKMLMSRLKQVDIFESLILITLFLPQVFPIKNISGRLIRKL